MGLFCIVVHLSVFDLAEDRDTRISASVWDSHICLICCFDWSYWAKSHPYTDMFSYKRKVFQWLKKKSNVLWFYIKIWQVVVSPRLAAVWNLKPCWWVFQLRQLLGVSCTWMSPLPTPVLWQHLAVAGEESGRFSFLSMWRNPFVHITHSPLAVVNLTLAGSSSPKFTFFSCKLEFYHVQQMVSLLFPLSWQPHLVPF